LNTPRLQIDLQKIQHNAAQLVRQLAGQGISVTGVTKAAQACVLIAQAMVRAGVQAIGESRIQNIEVLNGHLDQAPIWMQRAPMLAEAHSAVKLASLSFVTELDTVAALDAAAGRRGVVHDVLLMVEMGDLREGVMPGDAGNFIRQIERFDNIRLNGIGTNLACRSGIVPDTHNMAALSDLAARLERGLSIRIAIVSGGNSANLDWALNASDTGRINNLRLGESILLGCEPAHGRPLPGLYTDAFSLVAEVIESKRKPVQPWGSAGRTPFDSVSVLNAVVPAGQSKSSHIQSILAIGRQDVNPADLIAPASVELLAASSDHLIIDAGARVLPIGNEMAFGLNYAGLLAAMTSPFVKRTFISADTVMKADLLEPTR